jgi:anaerobic magnesium-protoporphyrin IX monomethyl ester cyclase
MFDVLLTNPRPVTMKGTKHEKLMYSHPAPGIGYLAAALRKINISVFLFDMGPSEKDADDILHFIEEHDVKILGISSFVANHGNGMRIAKYVKAHYPSIKIIMGGPQATFISEEILAAGCVDFVSFYEGERTLQELCSLILQGETDYSGVKGLAYIDDDNAYHRTEDRAYIQNLDDIGMPAWDLYELDKYICPGVILSGRGCPYRCIYCSAGAVSGSRYRTRSVNSVVDEIEYLYRECGVDYFFLADDTFTADKQHCIEICREIRRRNLNIHWEAEARANTVTDEIVKEMALAGCRHVQIGAESGDNQVLKDIGKNITTDTIEKAVCKFLRVGITVVCSFIIGTPTETHDTFQRTLDFALKIRRLSKHNFTNCKFAILTPLPGTSVYEDRDKWGIELLTTNWDNYDFYDPVIRTKNLSEKDLRNMFMKAWVEYTKTEEEPWAFKTIKTRELS